MKRLTLRFCAYLCVLLLALFSYSSLFANNVNGGEVSYKCTSTPGVFEVTLVLLRNCDAGVELCSGTCGAACTQAMTLRGADPGCASSNFGSFTVSLVSVRDINTNPDCPNTKNSCSNRGCVTPGTYTPGIERYEFKGTVNIGPTSGIPASCCNVRFTWETCCRSNEIATISSPFTANFYIDAVVNRCLSVSPCSSSPTMVNDPYVVICGGQNYVFNNGAIDSDLDSLSFAFAPALVGFNTSVTYLSPWAFDRPMPWAGNINSEFPGGIRCDPLTGDILFTPGNSGAQNFTGIMAVEVKQWKTINGVPTIIGITRRENQMVVLAGCPPNNPPRLITNPPNGSNPNAPKTSWDACAGEQLCFTVTAKDTDFILPTTSDTSYLSWNQAISNLGATFQPTYSPSDRGKPSPLGGPREDNWQFCWTPHDSLARSNPYLFTISAKDNRCPNSGRLTRAFSVKVIGKADLQINKGDLKCGKFKPFYTNNKPSIQPNLVQWQISRFPGDFSMSNNPYTFTNVSTCPVLQYKEPGKYLVKLSALTQGSSGIMCTRVFYDTLMVDTVMSIMVKDTFTCNGRPVTLSGIPLRGTPPYQFRWYNSIGDTSLTPLNSPDFSSMFYTATPTQSRKYIVELRDFSGCKVYDSVSVNIINQIKQVVTTPVTCFGEATGVIKVEVTDTNNSYQYQLNNDSFQSANIFSGIPSGTYTVKVKDTANCNSVAEDIFVPQPLQLSGAIVNRVPTCYSGSDASITVLPSNGTPPYSFNLDSGIYQTSNMFSDLVAKSYVVGIKDSNNCLNYLSSVITNPLPITGVVTPTAPTCFNRADGSLTITPSNGKLPYSFNLDSSAYQPLNVFNSLKAKDYIIGIKDSNNCGVYINSTIVNPPKIIAGGITGPNMVALNSMNTYSVFQQTNLNYQWILSKGTITSGVNTSAVTIQWDSVGTENLRVWVYQDSTCGDTAWIQVSIGGVGLTDVAALMGLTVFPNPTQSLLNITLSRLPAEQYLYLYDLQGKVKVQQEIQYNQQLDLQDLPSGMYFLVVGEWKGKVVKQ